MKSFNGNQFHTLGVTGWIGNMIDQPDQGPSQEEFSDVEKKAMIGLC